MINNICFNKGQQTQFYLFILHLEGGRSETEPKYRNDENVLESAPAQYRQITVDIQNTPPRTVRNL